MAFFVRCAFAYFLFMAHYKWLNYYYYYPSIFDMSLILIPINLY